YEATMEMDFSMSMGEEKLSMQLNAQIAQVLEPIKIKMVMDMSLNGFSINDIQMYMFENEQGAVDAYIGMLGMWEHETIEQDEMGEFVGQLNVPNVTDQLAAFKKITNGIREEGTETIDGVKYTKIVSALKGNAFEELLDELDLTELVDLDETEGMDISELFKDIPDCEIVYWIVDGSSPELGGMYIDLKPMMETYMNNLIAMLGEDAEAEAEMDLGVEAFSITMMYKNIGNVADFELPAEAK
ncbi:MAG: hypothetical protein IJN00_00520, partial [Clostridia bacterium]|nr:hypothetical protein [Clostridia bacterium]